MFRATWSGWILLLNLSLWGPLLVCQVKSEAKSAGVHSLPEEASRQGTDLAPFTVRVIAREVVVEFVARDELGRFVADLKPNELSISEEPPTIAAIPQEIRSLHLVKPGGTEAASVSQVDQQRVTLGGICARRFSVHYELEYSPKTSEWRGGYHKVLLNTSRHGVKLSYRTRYYAGEQRPGAGSQVSEKPMSELEREACYRPKSPLLVMLFARQIQSEGDDLLRYSLSISADSLDFTNIANRSRKVQMDYGVCMLDREGAIIEYADGTIDRALSLEEYRWSQQYGVSYLMDLDSSGRPALIRFAVRDRNSGNVGWEEVAILTPAQNELNSAEKRWADRNMASSHGEPVQTELTLPVGPIGSFGSIVPDLSALCGDVYELEGLSRLPDFWVLPSVSAIYTDTLNVPNQQFWNSRGIPGATRKTEWFGIDYYGKFWVRDGGEYQFRLEADDGAKLLIDDQLVVDLDGVHPAIAREGKISLNAGSHLIHIPYFQGPLGAVALILSVKEPNGSYKTFNIKDFAAAR